MSKELLEEQKKLAERTQSHIEGLLDERASLQKQTAERLQAIAEELKDLGWKAPRRKFVQPGTGTGPHGNLNPEVDLEAGS